MSSHRSSAGRFIVIDGPDGSGTTTHARLLSEALTREGRSCLLTTEPSDGPIGRFVRDLLHAGDPVAPDALQLLFVADRAWHVRDVIAPALARGKTVICDRYIASTIAYGESLGLDVSWLKELNKNFIHPDRSIFLLPPIAVCLQRLAKRERHDALELQELQERVHASYQRYAQQHPEILAIDSSGTKDAVAAQILEALL